MSNGIVLALILSSEILTMLFAYRYLHARHKRINWRDNKRVEQFIGEELTIEYDGVSHDAMIEAIGRDAHGKECALLRTALVDRLVTYHEFEMLVREHALRTDESMNADVIKLDEWRARRAG